MLVCAGSLGLWMLRSDGADLLSRKRVLLGGAAFYILACSDAASAVFYAVFFACAPDAYVENGVWGMSPFGIGMCVAGLCVLPLCVVILRRAKMIRTVAAKSFPCVECGYNLTGNTSGVCPECGEPIAEAVRQESETQSSDGTSLEA